MRAEVDLADVVVLEDGGVSCVGSVVSGAVVQRAAGGKSQTSVQTVFLDQLSGTVLQLLTVKDKNKYIEVLRGFILSHAQDFYLISA